MVTGVTVALLTVAVLEANTAAPASACSCVSTTDEAAFDQADVVFVGTVTDRVTPGDGTSGADDSTWQFSVTRLFKGDAPAAADVVTSGSGGSCGLELQGSGPFLVFASLRNRDQLTSGLCSGSRPITADVPAAFGSGRSPSSADSPPTTVTTLTTPAVPAAVETDGANAGWWVAGALALGALLLAGMVVGLRRRGVTMRRH